MSASVLFWVGVASTISAFAIVAWLAIPRRALGAYLGIMSAVLVGLGLMFCPTSDREAPDDHRDRLVYLGWTDGPFLEQLARALDRAGTTVVASPQATSFVQPYFRQSKVETLSGDGTDGVTVSAALADLHSRIAQRGPVDQVVMAAPRDPYPATVRQQFIELAHEYPGIGGAVKVLVPADLGLAWPSVLIDAPLIVSPYEPTMPVQVLAHGLPRSGTQILLTVIGPKQGDAFRTDGELTITPIGLNARGQLADNELAISVATTDWSASGLLAAPRESKTLTLEATAKNRFGETLAFHQATVTARIQPVGILIPKARETIESPFQVLLEDLHIENQRVVIDLGPSADVAAQARLLERWRALVCDQRLEGPEAVQFAAALRAASVRPKLLFAGNDSDSSELPSGWKTLMHRPLVPAVCRIILVGADTSGSMIGACGFGKMKKYEMAIELAKMLAGGLEQRRWNRLVVPVVGPDARTTFGPDDKEPVTVHNYAVPGTHAPWELYEMIHSAHKMAADGQPISDCVFIFDPEDVRVDEQLPQDARDAAEELWGKYGVRLWLVAAGRHTEATQLGPFVHGRVIASLGQHGGNPDTLKAALAKIVFEQMFPRITVEASDTNAGLVRGGWDRLSAYVRNHGDELRFLNGLCVFRPKAELPQHGEVSLWQKHWTNPTLFAPLLARDMLDLGGGETAEYLHLGLDLTAERASIPSVTDAQRNTLAGFLIRVIGALSDEFQEPGIYWTPAEGGLSFYPLNHSPFQIKTAPHPDLATFDGAGLALRIVDGYGQGRVDSTPDSRRLELLGLRPERLDRERPSLVRFFVEDQRPEIGAVTLHVPLRAPPPQPLAAVDVVGDVSHSGNARTHREPLWLVVPGGAVPYVFLVFWLVLIVALRRWL